MKITRILTFFVFMLVAMAVTAQHPGVKEDVPPIRWRTIINTTGENSGTVTFKALIAPGWHLYALDLPEGGPKPTTFDLSASEGVKFTGKIQPSRKPLKVEDAMFGMTLQWWDTNVEFTVPFKLEKGAKDPKIFCKIGYMTCDGESCRPPKTESITAPIKLTKK